MNPLRTGRGKGQVDIHILDKGPGFVPIFLQVLFYFLLGIGDIQADAVSAPQFGRQYRVEQYILDKDPGGETFLGVAFLPGLPAKFHIIINPHFA